MKKIKLLLPLVGLSALASAMIPLVGCSSNKFKPTPDPDPDPQPVVTKFDLSIETDDVEITCEQAGEEKLEENKAVDVVLKWTSDHKAISTSSLVVKCGNDTLTVDEDYTIARDDENKSFTISFSDNVIKGNIEIHPSLIKVLSLTWIKEGSGEYYEVVEKSIDSDCLSNATINIKTKSQFFVPVPNEESLTLTPTPLTYSNTNYNLERGTHYSFNQIGGQGSDMLFTITPAGAGFINEKLNSDPDLTTLVIDIMQEQ